MEIAVGFHSLTTTTHPANVNLPSWGQQVTARLSDRKVPVAGGNRAQDPLVRDTTKSSVPITFCTFFTFTIPLSRCFPVDSVPILTSFLSNSIIKWAELSSFSASWSRVSESKHFLQQESLCNVSISVYKTINLSFNQLTLVYIVSYFY